MTHCTQQRLEFQGVGRREVIGKFDAPAITSDAGGLLLREVDTKFEFIKQFAACFADHRNPQYPEHSLEDLLAQRIFGISLVANGYVEHGRQEPRAVDTMPQWGEPVRR